jgi:hypothetical protein
LDCNNFTGSDEVAQRWQAKGIPESVVNARIGTQAAKSRADKGVSKGVNVTTAIKRNMGGLSK